MVRDRRHWPAASRDDDGADRDWLGVEVTYRHSWITGALWWNGEVTWTDDTIMHLEPVVPYSS